MLSAEELQDKKILFGVPLAYDQLYWWTALSIMKTRWPSQHLRIENPIGMTTPLALNQIVVTGRKWGAEYFVFAPHDIQWEPDAITNLMLHDVDIVAASCQSRFPLQGRYRWHAMTDWDGKWGWKVATEKGVGLQKVDGIGGSLWVMKARVFDLMPSPWFEFKTLSASCTVPEDLVFSKKAKDSGIDMHVDWDTHAGHVASGLMTKDGMLTVAATGQALMRT